MTEGSGPQGSVARAPSVSRRRLERRRSERLLLTMPIRVEGFDARGEHFLEDTRTLVINREGARIYLQHPVTAGATITILTMGRRRKAGFRIVGPTKPVTSQGGEWGVECLEQGQDIWGIGFPPPTEEDEESCAALLECWQCHTTNLVRLSLVEHDVLATSGLLQRDCSTCGRPTSWGYSDRAQGAPPAQQVAGEAAAGGNGHVRGRAERRIHRRIALRLPIRVRNYYGVDEFATTENVSKSGLCFVSDKNYQVGEVLLVTCPYEKGGHNIEVRCQVMRRADMQGTSQEIYGIRYEK